MRVVVQQVDLDTCAAALVLGVSPDDEVVVAPAGAAAEDLENLAIICIEAGGSGNVARNNFDHHRPGGPVEAACRQALQASGCSDAWLARLVDYADTVDGAAGSCRRTALAPGETTLSALVSGVRLAMADPRDQLREVLRILRVLWKEGVHPDEPIRARAEWKPFVEARRLAARKLAAAAPSAHLFLSRSGLRVGFLAVSVPGALGVLYEVGCEIAIAYTPPGSRSDRQGGSGKFTIGGSDGRRVAHLLPLLAVLEPGWGGPAGGAIIGSPRTGTRLTPEIVKALVRDHV